MVRALFQEIVILFTNGAALVGITYALLNIWVYCLFVPWTWCAVAAFRLRSVRLAAAGTGFFAAGLAVTRLLSESVVQRFYDHQIRFLELLSSDDESGYVRLSLVIGVAAPAFLYAMLGFVPRRFLLPMYLVLNTALVAYLLVGWGSGSPGHRGFSR